MSDFSTPIEHALHGTVEGGGNGNPVRVDAPLRDKSGLSLGSRVWAANPNPHPSHPNPHPSRPNPHPDPNPHPSPNPRPSKVALGNLQNKKGPVGEGGFLYDSTKPAP